MKNHTKEAQRAASLLGVREIARIGGLLDIRFSRHVTFYVLSVRRVDGKLDRVELELDNNDKLVFTKDEL